MNFSLEKRERLDTLQVSDPEELGKALPDIGNNGVATHYLALAVNNPQLMVCPFHLEDVKDMKEVKDRLVMEAVEMLSLPSDSVGIDYQTFEFSEGKARGVYVCYPKLLIENYLKGADRAGYVPVKIVPSILAGIDTFLEQYKGKRGRFCLFDFSKDNVVYFAVFANGTCDFLREFHYETDEEIKHELVQSLRCACSMSSVKQFDHVFLSGEVPGKKGLVSTIKKQFCENVTHGYFTDVDVSLKRNNVAFGLNLIKHSTFSLQQRRTIKYVERGVAAVLGIVILALSVQIFINQFKLKELKSSYTESDYNYAKDLKRRLKEVNKNEQ